MLVFETPSILISKPSLSLPMPYLQPVIFEVTNKFVSKCFEILLTLKIVISLVRLAGNTSISARRSSTPRLFSVKLSKSKLNFSVFLSNIESIPITYSSSMLKINKDAPESIALSSFICV